MPEELIQQIEAAKQGDEDALEVLLRGVQKQIYSLSLRMLGNPTDAEDATQEILIRLLKNLSSFRGESSFSTWSFRVASNYLLSFQANRKRDEMREISFAQFGQILDTGLLAASQQTEEDPTDDLLVEEVRLSCSQGMLLCLDRPHRLTYLLVEIFGLDHGQCAYILDVTKEAARKRLSRARERLKFFVAERCGVYNANNPCRCTLQVSHTIRTSMIDPSRLHFAKHPAKKTQSVPYREMLGLMNLAALYQTHPDYIPPQDFVAAIKNVIGNKQLF